MSNEQERPEDQLERMLAEHAAGIPSPQHPEFDRLVGAGERLRDAQRSAPPPLGRNRAFSRMMNEVESERMRSKTGRFAGFWSGLVSRPVAGTALSAAVGLIVISALGIGVATATGNGEPVREFLRISHSSTDLEFRGTIVSIGSTDITVDSGGVLHVLTTSAATRIKEHGDTVDAARLVVGANVEVHAQTQADGSVLALTIGIEDDATPAAGTPAAGTPAAGPTVDDHGGDRPREDRTPDDNSGQGSDDATPEDNSGHGSDDATPEDNSGHGSDDGTSDDNSGSGSGSDALSADDNSGSGSGSDDRSADDNSISGSGPDNSSNDNSGSGHGSDDGGGSGGNSGHGGGN